MARNISNIKAAKISEYFDISENKSSENHAK
jgi:hypothetical protein